MLYDHITFTVEEEPNPDYEEQHKAFLANGEDWYSVPSEIFIIPTMYINGEPINGTISPNSLIHTKTTKDCYARWDGRDDQKRSYSLFEPITCSCGVAGCAGIWDGIHMKVRRHTVEWRVPKNAGYDGVFYKSFFTFRKDQYFKAIEELEAKVEHYTKLYPDGDQLIFL